MDKRPGFKSFKEDVLKNAKVREEYEALRPEFELMIEFIKARKSAKLSQEAKLLFLWNISWMASRAVHASPTGRSYVERRRELLTGMGCDRM